MANSKSVTTGWLPESEVPFIWRLPVRGRFSLVALGIYILLDKLCPTLHILQKT